MYPVKVLRTFLEAGVPINKIDDFRDLLEEHVCRLAGRKPMSDLIPFILNEEQKQLLLKSNESLLLSYSMEHHDLVKPSL